MAIKRFEIRSNLAQAIDDTVVAARSNAGALHVEIIAINNIELDPDNPRELLINISDVRDGITKDDLKFKEKSKEIEGLQTLKNSILNQGIINPITVYKYSDKYRVIAGERRTLASHLAQIQQLPVRILSQRPTQLDLSLIQWIENIERADLTLWERLKNIEKISMAFNEEGKEFNATNLSVMLGCSRQLSTNYLVVLEANEELKEAIKSDRIKNLEKAAVIARAPLGNLSILIDKCIKGATLKDLKKISEQLSRAPNKPASVKKFNFGVTNNNSVAKTIMTAVINSLDDLEIKNKFKEIDWNDVDVVNKSFRALISYIEKSNT